MWLVFQGGDHHKNRHVQLKGIREIFRHFWHHELFPNIIIPNIEIPKPEHKNPKKDPKILASFLELVEGERD
jgi:hypothetical protein